MLLQGIWMFQQRRLECFTFLEIDKVGSLWWRTQIVGSHVLDTFKAKIPVPVYVLVNNSVSVKTLPLFGYPGSAVVFKSFMGYILYVEEGSGYDTIVSLSIFEDFIATVVSCICQKETR